MPQIIDRARWLRQDAIEYEAAELLSRFEQENGPIIQPPIPVERLIESTLDLAIDWCKIVEKVGETILACIDPQERTIRMNESHRDHFERFLGSEAFTLAHEAGHWVMHVQDTSAIQLSLFATPVCRPFICRGIGRGKPDPFEWQANQFAAALLMPRSLLGEWAGKLDLCNQPDLYYLKDLFGVTVTALRYRLVDLGMLFVSEDKRLYANREAYVGQQRLI